MAQTSKVGHIIATLRTALATESTFRVVNVWRDNYVDDKTLIYPFVQGAVYSGMYQAQAFQSSDGIATVGIMCNKKTTADTDGSGTTTEEMGIALRKIEKALYDYDVEGVAANNDGTFTTKLQGWVVDQHDGHYDIADGKIQFAVQVSVMFTHHRNT